MCEFRESILLRKAKYKQKLPPGAVLLCAFAGNKIWSIILREALYFYLKKTKNKIQSTPAVKVHKQDTL